MKYQKLQEECQCRRIKHQRLLVRIFIQYFNVKMSNYFCYFQEITTAKPSFGISDISNSSDAEMMKGERVLLLILNETNFN